MAPFPGSCCQLPPSTRLESAWKHSVSERQRRWWRRRWAGLLMAGVPLMMMALTSWGIGVPTISCPFRAFTGIPCPTCGLTRSLLAIATGDWGHAITAHLFGPLVVVGCILAVGHSGVELMIGRSVTTFYTRIGRHPGWQSALAVAIALYHGSRLMQWASSGELPAMAANSGLAALLQNW